MHTGRLVFAQHLIAIARRLYAEEPIGLDLKETVYALDATTIDLCLSLFPWAPFRTTKAAVKLHTLLDLRGNIPSFLHITDGKVHDVNVLDLLVPEAGAFYVVDRGYVDFARLARFDALGAFFVTRTKSNFHFTRLSAQAVDKYTGLICDQRVALTVFYSKVMSSRCAVSAIASRSPASAWYSSPTTSACQHSRFASSTACDGRWSFSSNGSSNTDSINCLTLRHLRQFQSMRISN